MENDKNNSNGIRSLKEIISDIKLWSEGVVDDLEKTSDEEKTKFLHEINQIKTSVHLLEQWILKKVSEKKFEGRGQKINQNCIVLLHSNTL